PRVLGWLASAYNLKQENERAEQLYESAVTACENQTPGECAQYYNELGAFYFAGGSYKKAEVNWRKVTEQDPLNPFGHSNLGGALLQQGCVDEAIGILTYSLKVRETTDGYSNRSTAFFFQGKFREAVTDFERITYNGQDLTDDKRPNDLWGYLGDAY